MGLDPHPGVTSPSVDFINSFIFFLYIIKLAVPSVETFNRFISVGMDIIIFPSNFIDLSRPACVFSEQLLGLLHSGLRTAIFSTLIA